MAATPTNTLIAGGLSPLILSLRLKEGSLCGPSKLEHSVPHPTLGGAESLAQFGETGSNPANGDKDVTPHVSLLLLWRGPLAIIFAVAKRIIFTINRSSKWLLAHISEEILKTFPPLANLNPATSVVAPSLIVRVGAALAHRLPSAISRSPGFIGRMPVREIERSARLCIEASTRPSSSAFEVDVQFYSLHAASASAKAGPVFPSRTSDFDGGYRNNDQPSKSLSDKIGLTLTGWGRSLVLHDEFVSLCRVSGCWQQRRDIFIIRKVA